MNFLQKACVISCSVVNFISTTYTYYHICLHFQASNLQPAATGYRFIAHLAWLWCRTFTFYKAKSVVNTRAGYNMKSRKSSVIVLGIWTYASGCFWHWSVGKTRKLKRLYSSHCSFDIESPQYSTCIMKPSEGLEPILFGVRLRCIYFWSL